MIKKPLQMSKLTSAHPEIEFPPQDGEESGRIVKVRPITGRGIALLREWDDNPENSQLLWDVTALCLPSFSRDEVDDLTATECTAVVAMARGLTDVVEKMFEDMPGNGMAPEVTVTEETTAQPSTSPTPSDSSMRQSLEPTASE